MTRALRKRYGHARSTQQYVYEETAGADEGLTKSFRTLQGAIDFGNKRFGFKGPSPLGVQAVGARVASYKRASGPSALSVEAEWRNPFDRQLIGMVWR